MKELKFPKNFLWGTATSSYQVEGNIRNDWSEWETSNARISRLKKQKRNPEEFINKRACNHYNLYERDFDLAKQLHNNAHRFSVEWARIESKQERFDAREIGHYRRVINSLRKRKLEPFLTAHHFTLPLWVAQQGGWLNRKAVKYFEDYISKLVNEFRDVKFWITINEPVILMYRCYLEGSWPPCSKSIIKSFTALRNMIEAHKRAYKIIHEINGQAGIANNTIYFRGLYIHCDYPFNWYVLDSLKNHQDFVGLNYYMMSSFPRARNIEKSEMGWEIYPEGIYFILKSLAKYRVPVYITENGIADSTDSRRGRYIVQHLQQVHRAISEGIDVRGYFHWSLLDNFEWADGFTKKFGLVEVNYKNMKRIPRKSFFTYSKICKLNKISGEMQKIFCRNL